MQPRQIRDTSRPVRPSLVYSTLYLSIIQDIRAENGPSGMRLHQTGRSRCNKPSITSLPVDHVVQLAAIAISTKVVAENIHAARSGSAPNALPPAVPASLGLSADHWSGDVPRFRCSR